jgi:deazaflavin-dependent oxidoreductase (nitroreductase family)
LKEMAKFHQLPTKIYRLIKHPPQIAYALGLGPVIGGLILLLTTKGRVTGNPRVTPLQYEKIGDVYYVGATRGIRSDWVKNILKDPRVKIRVKSQKINGNADVITDPSKIADYLEFRLEKHPRMMGAMLKADGIPSAPNRAQLEEYADQVVLVAIRPT